MKFKMTKKQLPRGLRMNNPLNIEISPDKFQGEIRPSSDSRFKQFKSIEYGYRAAFRILLTYRNKYGLKTLREWITRWAPPIENNTQSYIDTVSRVAKVLPDVEIDTENKDFMCRIVAAMSRVENGVNADMKDVERGYNLL